MAATAALSEAAAVQPAPTLPSLDELLTSALHTVVLWLTDQAEPIPLDSTLVSGASERELLHLAHLGRLVADVMNRYPLGRATFPAGALGTQDAVAQWMAQRAFAPANVTDALAHLAQTEGATGLADLYGTLVAGQRRRHLGTFFTPRSEVAWMLNRWSAAAPEPGLVVDVGAGVGAFSLAAASRWPEVRIDAVDINPVTLGLLGLALNAPTHVSAAERTTLLLADGVDYLTGQVPSLTPPVLYLGNPPYTRLQLLPKAKREEMLAAAGGLVGSRASLSAILTAMAVRRLRPQDGVCLLLPASWLEADYARDLREHLWKMTSRDVLIHLFEASLFPDAQVDATALLVYPERSTGAAVRYESPGRLLAEGQDARAAKEGGHNWRQRFRIPLDRRSSDTNDDNSVPLSELASIRRGVATGDNSFFLFSQDSARRLGVAPEVLTPLLKRLRDCPTDELTNSHLDSLPGSKLRYLLVVTEDARLEMQEVIERGISLGVDLRFLAKRRTNWYDLSAEVVQPDVIVGAATRAAVRFVRNDAHAAIANNLYGMTWSETIDGSDRERVLTYLRGEDGQREMLAKARVQATGLLKLEPRALQSIRVPLSDLRARQLHRKGSICGE